MISNQSQIDVITTGADDEETGVESNCNSISFINNGTQDCWIYNENSDELKLPSGSSISFTCQNDTNLIDTWFWYFNSSTGAELSIIRQLVGKQD